ncbi:hypothetical protein Lal_00001369 [Lupinus albus]|nr:hypothetical protein Lal_00001369 [Lupinus albus]
MDDMLLCSHSRTFSLDESSGYRKHWWLFWIVLVTIGALKQIIVYNYSSLPRFNKELSSVSFVSSKIQQRIIIILYNKGMLERVVNPHLDGQIKVRSLKKFGETKEKCLA